MKKHPIPIVHYISGFIAIVGLWGAFLVPNANATVIAMQNNSQDVFSYNPGYQANFAFGSGLQGTMQGFSLFLSQTSVSGTIRVNFQECDYGYVNCTAFATTTSQAVTTSKKAYTLNLTSLGLTFQTDKYYWVQISMRSGGSDVAFKIYGVVNGSGYPIANYCFEDNSTPCDFEDSIAYQISTSYGFYDPTLYGFYNSLSALTDSSGYNVTTSTLSTVSELQCGALDILSGTCFVSVLSYIFIPNPAILNQFSDLQVQLATKIPFSYVYSIENAVNNIALSTSSESFPLISIPLSSVASSTVTGVIPDIEMTTSTISTYLTPTFHNALYALLVAAIWLNVGWLFFREAMRIFKS